MSENMQDMVHKSVRVPRKPVVKAATIEEIQQLHNLIDELAFRVLTLEVANNNNVNEINHVNEWLKEFRARHEVLLKLAWYRWYLYLSPHMGLPRFPKRDRLRGIRIRDTIPRMKDAGAFKAVNGKKSGDAKL